MKTRPLPSIFLAAICLSFPACDQVEQFRGGGLQIEGEHGGIAEVAAHEIIHSESEHHAEAHGEGHAEEGHGEGEHAGGEHHPQHKVLVTSPVAKDVISTQRYVCQIHSRRHIEIRALEGGYLEQVPVKEGQFVQKGTLMFKILPILYQAKLDSDIAESQRAQIEYNNTEKLVQQNVVSSQELALARAKLAQAQAKVKLAQAELDFANVKAPFDGIMDRLHEQIGSLVEEGDILTTLSDNEVMWVYFNVPEARYLEYKAALDASPAHADIQVELILANHDKFPQHGEIGAIEADFNNETGNIAFRADFPNPNALLRHGQTGTVLINRLLRNAIVIPQRATFEILAKRYAYVVDAENVVHQREIVIQTEMDDIFVIKDGLHAGERIVLEGLRQVRDGDKVKYEFIDPSVVLSNLKHKAE
ncbi:Multidrug resistance protein MdtE precursor [Roseimaritima multifibrata]|uniref:Multidrug resistance protein MdtE n=1 Tax=Roseimaritima multifibrata TaxID=1930274 RepID=A0A517MMA0_9BACT|nr:efflux RND transporter periplasmic adaptor subunit [Roseimaritima multifibrata]QDS95999.1 Multidrug resistance protein MdtE precursor [Roseimaritima multifibrata]